jgi:hypothetical protein
MEQYSSSEGNYSSASQDIPHILWNPKLHTAFINAHLLSSRMHVFQVLISSRNRIIPFLIFLSSHVLFPTFTTTTTAVIISSEELFYSQLISVCVLRYQPSCHISCQLAAILKSVAVKLLSHCRKQMPVFQHEIREIYRIFHDTLVIKLYPILTYFVTDISPLLAFPFPTNVCVYSCLVNGLIIFK